MRPHDAILQGEDLKTYVYDRKLHPDENMQKEQEKHLKKIKIHNAFFSEEVRDLLNDIDENFIEYFPKKSSETHFWVPDKGIIHVVNPRGIIRLNRDIELIEALEDITCKKIECKQRHYGKDEVKAANHFGKIGFLLGDRINEEIKKLDLDIDKRVNLLFGPHKSINFNNLEVLAEQDSEFLNYKIMMVGNNPVISFDYIFADQAKNLLSKLYRIFGSKNDKQNPKREVNVFHYGKIGCLNPKLSVGNICVPYAGMEEEKILDGRDIVYPLENLLTEENIPSEIFKEAIGQNINYGITVNTISVLGQRRKNLEKALNAGGDFLEMEWVPMSGPNMGASTAYGKIKVNHFYAGVISDKPLEGKNLGNTEYPRNVQNIITNAHLEIIKHL